MLWGQGTRRENGSKVQDYMRQILGFVLLALLVEAGVLYLASA